jgi:hypothetical protein
MIRPHQRWSSLILEVLNLKETVKAAFSLLFKHFKRIKVLNKKGFDAGTIEIPLYFNWNKEEKGTNLKAVKERKYDIELRSEYKDVDSVEIKIPPGYETEALPKDNKIESKFGKYISSVKVMPDKILYYRYQEQYSGEFPAKDYPDVVSYYEKIYKADRNKVVLVKKEWKEQNNE